MASSLGGLISESSKRGYVFVWQLDGVLLEPLLEVFHELEAAGIEVVGEQEPEIPDVVAVYLASVGVAPRLTRRREVELAIDVSGGGRPAERAEKELLESSMRIAAFTAVRCPRPGVDVLDRISEANRLLMQAFESFDFVRGSNFTSYATWFIRHELKKTAAS